MFDVLIKELATKFGLGEKAMPLMQMVLAYMTNKETGGLSGFMDKFSDAGLGHLSQSWLGAGPDAKTLENDQITQVLGGNDGLVSQITSKLGINSGVATSALGFLLPSVIGKLSPEGKLPFGLPNELGSLLSTGQNLLGASAAGVGAVAGASAGATGALIGATGAAAGAATGGVMKYFPWIAAAAAVVFGISYCNSKSPEVTAPVSAPTAPAAAPLAAPAAAPVTEPAAAVATSPAPVAETSAVVADPQGSAVVAWNFEGSPALKVFFDSGKALIAPEFADKGVTLVEFLKANSNAKAVISGFNDPTGDPAKNAELAKTRAQAVQAALVGLGVANKQTLVEKAAGATDASTSNAQARRVEVVIRK
jgi:uncharacterized protein YidB (DUF937 family)/outer membrane protein OmpA-like peptidoglycan-associated protein